jgi:hypothetical protein
MYIVHWIDLNVSPKQFLYFMGCASCQRLHVSTLLISCPVRKYTYNKLYICSDLAWTIYSDIYICITRLSTIVCQWWHTNDLHIRDTWIHPLLLLCLSIISFLCSIFSTTVCLLFDVLSLYWFSSFDLRFLIIPRPFVTALSQRCFFVC